MRAMSLTVESVSPDFAASRPSSAGMFPALMVPIISLYGPMNMQTCCTRWSTRAPRRWNVDPSLIVPEKSLPLATTPAWGSTTMLVIAMTTGPLSSQFIIAWPTSLLMSPFQILGIRYFCATCGGGMLQLPCSVWLRAVVPFPKPRYSSS